MGTAGGSSGTGGGAGGGAAGADADCAPTPLVKRRIVRLDTNQVVNSVAALMGAGVAAEAVADDNIEPRTLRDFPPLASGSAMTVTSFDLYDRVARKVGEHVLEEFDTETGCGTTPTEACARDYLLEFAERAFRRPLVDAERESFLTVYDECKGFGGTVPEAVQHGVCAVLDSPGFLYRTELGEGDSTEPEILLASYELASELAYFLTDAPPDGELLEAAARGELSSPDEIGEHAVRLLSTAAGRATFEAAMTSYFRLGVVTYVVIDPESVPGIVPSTGLFESMAREGELFFRETLWTGDFRDLLVSRRAYVNDSLATPIYGVPAPTDVDADGFGPVVLPEIRAEILTSSPLLTMSSRSNGPSVVGRGLLVNAALACQMNPPFPEGEDFPSTMPDPNATEREKAAWRAEQAVCAGCHVLFDSFGLALDVFDAVGRERDSDLSGRPIDPAVTLPEIFDNREVSGPAEMAAVIAESPVFKACLAMSFMNYAFADESRGSARAPLPNQPAESCMVDEVVRAFDESGDPSFSSLLVQIARSPALRLRQGDP